MRWRRAERLGVRAASRRRGDGLAAGEWCAPATCATANASGKPRRCSRWREGRVLVFTLAMARKLTPQDDALLLRVLSSYRAA
ncbi:hypothetical protein SL267_22120 [Serratia marcescens]|nr:hypothetical protein SL267_22120 [Serratia marcescens]